MRRTRTGALGLLAVVLAVAGVAGCGSGGSSSSSTTAPSVASVATTTPAATTATSSPAAPVAKPTGTAPQHSSPVPSSSSTAAGSGGGATSFRVAHGDNSIPDFGQEAPASERQRAAAALAVFLRARANGEWSTACAYLASPTRRQLEMFAKASKGKVDGCGAVLGALSRGPAAGRADTLTAGVAAVRVKGQSAFALFRGPHASKYVMPMRNEGGAWKVSELAPLAYPLGSSGAAAP